MKPNVTLKGKNPNMAVYGHLLSLIGSLLAVVIGTLSLINSAKFNGIIGIVAGIFILVVELGKFELLFLKDPLMRGIVWILLAVVASIGDWLTGLAIVVGGILYILYASSENN